MTAKLIKNRLKYVRINFAVIQKSRKLGSVRPEKAILPQAERAIQSTHNLLVPGSSPGGRTKLSEPLSIY